VSLHDRICALALTANIKVNVIEQLPASGGDRLYLRVQSTIGNFIATYSNNLQENHTFFEWTKTFAALQLPVPKIIAIAPEKDLYLQEDLGTICLLDFLLEQQLEAKQHYKTVLNNLASMQVKAHEHINYGLCLVRKKFDKEAALFDLNYFVQYYLSTRQVNYDANKLNAEFMQLADAVDAIEPQGFMYRDLQGRNIMLHGEVPYFIDYQGGMQGPLQYDVASLLWQAKANLPQAWKDELLDYYILELKKILDVDEISFKHNYNRIVLMRLLQVLGAYGRRGLLEGKKHFIDSIPQGLANVKFFARHISLEHEMPELAAIIVQL
jgi:aminoglycoside/choline kinase family phosphotransferase